MESSENTRVEFLSWASAAMVFLLAIGAFALSYNALRDVASNNGLDSWRSYVWPLLVDAALVIFSIAVVRANLLGERSWWPWGLVAVFTVGTIVFNLVHASERLTELNLIVVSIPLRHLVAVVPPVALVLSFETLMSMLRGTLRRRWLVKSGAELEQHLDNLRQQVQTERDKYQAQADGLRQELQTERDKHQAEQDKLRKELETLQRQVEAKRQELAAAGRRPVIVIGDTDPVAMGPGERQPYIAEMVGAGVQEADILETFQISAKTLGRDLKSLNGQVMK